MSTTSTRPSVRHWFHRLVSGKPHQIIGSGSNPYMHRWYLVPTNPWVKVYVHKFLRSDDDRALHDHPWSFVSVILRGGYVEISESSEHKTTLLCRSSIFDVRSPFWRRAIVFRPATYRHRVSLLINQGVEQPCWTLIVTGPHVREWGFWCKQTLLSISGRHVPSERFVPWQEFGGNGCGETS